MHFYEILKKMKSLVFLHCLEEKHDVTEILCVLLNGTIEICRQ